MTKAAPHNNDDGATDGGASTGRAASRTGLGAISSERFDAAAAVGGWRGVAESVLPTLVFVVVMALRPTALVTAVVASLALSALAAGARLAQRQPLTQALGGAVLALVSAAWAWRSGQASNFYATGLIINAVWLTGCLVSLVVRWPLVGVLMELWRAGSGQDEPARTGLWSSWRTDPERAADRRRHVLATAVLSAMFALRLLVEVPLYLAGQEAVSALGVARLVLGVPLFAVTLWFVWLLVRPAQRP
ncbi:DUF3159 domain-containing protein [Actinomyces sp. W5033]|uniref:DUF3159 domain-containing protein n=1 Tax=Actinomyces sp. W5033 TaxID=3446479 RepID=UPI003EE04976